MTKSLGVAVKELSVRLGELDVLDRISFTVRQGESLCIVGPSGCGKTTLLRSILDLVPAQCGNVVIDQVLSESIGYVAQIPLLYPWRTVLQNAVLTLEARGELTAPAVDYVEHLLGRYGLAGFEDYLPDRLSGGMAQRVAVVRALAARPRLLFCDEPFSAVDFVTRFDLNTKFRHICAVNKTTLILITHNIEEAIFLGDRVLVLSDRPAGVVRVYNTRKFEPKDSAVELRLKPDFGTMFKEIWEDLKGTRRSR